MPVDGYPTDAELERLRTWPMDDARGWLEYARSLWWNQAWGWTTLDAEVHTGGWSGNEEIIATMQAAQHGLLWHQVWRVTRRGGHYVFEVPK